MAADPVDGSASDSLNARGRPLSQFDDQCGQSRQVTGWIGQHWVDIGRISVAAAADGRMDGDHAGGHGLEQRDGGALVVAHEEQGVPTRQNVPILGSRFAPVEDEAGSIRQLALQPRPFRSIAQEFETVVNASCIQTRHQLRDAVDALLFVGDAAAETQTERRTPWPGRPS